MHVAIFSERFEWHAICRLRCLHKLVPLPILVAVALTGCGEKPEQHAAASAPPSVTVSHPTKRTVTDWDEFTGRFQAVEEVQVRARVGGFVTNVEFRDGELVSAGDLLYVIDPRPLRRSPCRRTANSRMRAPKLNSPSVNSIAP